MVARQLAEGEAVLLAGWLFKQSGWILSHMSWRVCHRPRLARHALAAQPDAEPHGDARFLAAPGCAHPHQRPTPAAPTPKSCTGDFRREWRRRYFIVASGPDGAHILYYRDPVRRRGASRTTGRIAACTGLCNSPASSRLVPPMDARSAHTGLRAAHTYMIPATARAP